MKNILILTLFFFLAIPGIILADPSEIGLKAGFTGNTIGGTNVSVINQFSMAGYSLGVFGDLGLSDFLAFQPEACFTVKGDYGLSPNFAYTPDNVDEFRYYLEFPMLLKAKILTVGQLKLNGLVGPYFAFLIQTQNFLTPYLDNSPSFNKFDTGVVFGASVELDNFVLDGRWEGGLTSFYNGVFAGTAAQNVHNVTNETFIISLGYKFFQL